MPNHRPAKTDALSLLKKDHEKVRELLNQLESTTERAQQRRTQLLEEIAEEVRVHTQIEEEIFYPAFREAASKKEDSKIYFEAIEEHHVVDMVLPEIEATDVQAEEFAAKAKVLKDIIEHHAKEEEKEMFPRARKLMDSDELKELGQRLEERKESLRGAAAGAAPSRGAGRGASRRGRSLEAGA